MLFVERNDVEFYIVLSLGDFFFLSMFTVILQKLYDGVVPAVDIMGILVSTWEVVH